MQTFKQWGLVLTLLSAFLVPAGAQDGILRGRLIDSTDHRGIGGIEVRLLGPDSALAGSTNTGLDGRFKLSGLKTGQYLFLAKHPKYSFYSQQVIIDPKNVLDIGAISLAPVADSLAPVIVTPRGSPITLKGDTLEYSTGGMRLKPNATVEELLHRLPGVQVNPDGTIYVNGKKVEKLLVDGENIFGNDPKTVTRTFNGDLFAKVQVLEKKSDRAAFTNIDDGSTSTTLNLVTKEDRKKGVFGKVEAGAGSGSYYDNTGFLGSFRGKRQLVALGLASNTGTNGLSGSGGGNEAATISVDAGIDNGLNASAGSGVPHTAAGGVHYSNKWDARQEHISGSYVYGHTIAYPFTTSILQQALPDSLLVQQQTSRSTNTADDHAFSGLYDINPDSLSSLRLAVDGHSGSSINKLANDASTRINGNLVNEASRQVSSNDDDRSFKTSAYWNRKMGKRRAMLSASANVNFNQGHSSGFLFSTQSFQHAASDTIDQEKKLDKAGAAVEATANYIQPLSGTVSLALSYGLNYSGSKTRLETYNKSDGKYTNLADSLSADFRPSITSQRETFNLILKKASYIVTAGSDITQQSVDVTDRQHNIQSVYRYRLFSPRIFGHYSFDQRHVLYFNYNYASRLPGLNQLQTFQNNSDPLHIVEGNPQLRPTGTHTLAARYMWVKGMPFNVGFYGNLLDHDITSQTFTDSLGRQITRPVNIDGARSISVYTNINRKLPHIDVDLGIALDAGYSRINSYVNTLLSKNNSYEANAHISLGKAFEDKYNVQFSSNIYYSRLVTSVNPQQTHYITQLHTFLVDLQLPAGLGLNSSLSLNILQKTSFAPGSQLWVWDAYINKDFLSGALSFRLRGSDLLGQRTGLSRTIAAGQITETNTNSVPGRYILLSAAFHFPQKKKGI